MAGGEFLLLLVCTSRDARPIRLYCHPSCSRTSMVPALCLVLVVSRSLCWGPAQAQQTVSEPLPSFLGPNAACCCWFLVEGCIRQASTATAAEGVRSADNCLLPTQFASWACGTGGSTSTSRTLSGCSSCSPQMAAQAQVCHAISSQCACTAAGQGAVLQAYITPALPRCCCCCCTTITTHSELAGAVQHQPQPAVE